MAEALDTKGLAEAQETDSMANNGEAEIPAETPEMSAEGQEAENNAGETEQVDNPDAKWYVVHTYSGYENKVKKDLEKAIENRKLQNLILEVLVPMEEVDEYKEGAHKSSQKKMLPGYVLVHMVHTDMTWYVVRNTRGVTGFVGPGGDLVPLEPEELARMGISTGGDVVRRERPVYIDLQVGDMVVITSEQFQGMTGPVRSINESKQRVTIAVDMFGGATLELGFGEVRKMK